VASPMLRRRRVSRLILATFLLGALLAAYLYLFRTGTTPFLPGEVATVRWEWGSPKVVEVDIDHDGRADFEGTFRGWSWCRSADDTFETARSRPRSAMEFLMPTKPESGRFASTMTGTVVASPILSTRDSKRWRKPVKSGEAGFRSGE
jgi:hypothetical protein